MTAGALSGKEKLRIGCVCASVMRDPISTRDHIRKAIAAGWSKKEVASAFAVAWNTCGATQIYWAEEKFTALIGEKWYKKHPNL